MGRKIIDLIFKWADFPRVGFSFDLTLLAHFIRDALMTIARWGMFAVIGFLLGNESLAYGYLGLVAATWLQFGFSEGWEGKDGTIMFFGVGDYVAAILAVNSVLLGAIVLIDGFGDLMIVFWNFLSMLTVGFIVVAFLLIVNAIKGRPFEFIGGNDKEI